MCPDKQCQVRHTGQIYAIGLEFRSQAAVEVGTICVQVKELVSPKDLLKEGSDDPINNAIKTLHPAPTNDEIWLTSSLFKISEADCLGRVTNIDADYNFQEPHGHGRARTSRSGRLILRRVLELVYGVDDSMTYYIQPIYQNTPIRGKLKIKEYTRTHFIDTFDINDPSYVKTEDRDQIKDYISVP